MLKKRLYSFYYAFRGIRILFRTQPNARIHAAALIVVCSIAFFFRVSLLEWALLLGAIAMVLAAEALNTSIEFLTDLVSPGYHPLAGKAKDVAAAGVLFTAISAAMIGLLIFIPKLLDWLEYP